MVAVLREDGRPGGRIQLLTVDAEAGQVRPDQDASQGRRIPAATSRRWDATGIEFSTKRGQGLASQRPVGQLLDDGGLIRIDGAEVSAIAIPPGAAASGRSEATCPAGSSSRP